MAEQLKEKEKNCDFSLHRISKFLQPSLLLFLSKSPNHGYDLIEKLKNLGFHQESTDTGAVYRNLRKLEKEGFLKSVWKVKGGRKKRIYKITPQGKTLLKAWMERIKERKEALTNFLEIYKEVVNGK